MKKLKEKSGNEIPPGMEQHLIFQNLSEEDLHLMSWRFYLNNTWYTIYSLLLGEVMDGTIISIYKEFQRELKLNQDTIDYAQRLHENLIEKNPFKYESPYLIVAICIFTVSRISEMPKTLKEVAEVSHIREVDLKKCYEMVFEQIEDSLNKL